MGDFVIATKFATAQQKSEGIDGEPIMFRFGATYVALLKMQPPVKNGLQNWAIATAPSMEGPFDFVENSFGKRMNNPLIAALELAESTINSLIDEIAALKKGKKAVKPSTKAVTVSVETEDTAEPSEATLVKITGKKKATPSKTAAKAVLFS